MKLLLYCTKSKPYLIGSKDAPYKYYLDKGGKDSVMDARDFIHNGKIIAECDFEVEEIKREIMTGIYECSWIKPSKYDWYFDKDLLDKSCLSKDMLCDYLDGNTGYAIHIKNLNIFDKPRKLNFYHNAPILMCLLENAPQNMMYVYDYKGGTRFEKKVLISIRPEWLCKILNGEKTIEIRKKVLKEMI